ncbi:hypothetical protein [uncultured Sphingomonas sp.]|uniref:hypothetical protein n=1 Tax=uncultured Sphingomonas sp. TaxID=158754 RepID=UPI0037480330
MTFDGAVHPTAANTGRVFAQRSLEHLRPAARRGEGWLFAPRLVLLLARIEAAVGAVAWLPIVTIALVAKHLLILALFNASHNGGADRTSMLVLLCLTGTVVLPDPQ